MEEYEGWEEISQQITSKEERQRLKQIIQSFSQHHVIKHLILQKNPEEVCLAFEELGPSFVKMGQFLSVRTDIFKTTFVEGLKRLQERSVTHDFLTVQTELESELQKPLLEVFQSFEEVPIASASMGQTHVAYLKNGQKVVVKLQHPDITKKIQMDIALLEKAIPLLESVPESDVIHPSLLIQEVKKSFQLELNGYNEVQNGQKFYQLNNGWDIIRSPKMYPDYSTSKVVVSEFMEGTSINQVIQEKREATRYSKELADRNQYLGEVLLDNFVKQVFEDGFFHADPHPGNLFARPRPLNQPNMPKRKRIGQIGDWHYETTWQSNQPKSDYELVYLDFGMMGSIQEEMLDKLTNVVIAIYTKNSETIGMALLQLCQQVGPMKRSRFFLDLEEFLAPYYDMPVQDMDFQLISNQIMGICHQHQLQVPSEIMLLVKAFLTLEGIVEQLHPSLSMMDVATPFAMQKLIERFDMRKEGKKAAFDLLGFVKVMPKIPIRMFEAISTLARGQLHLTVQLEKEEKLWKHFQYLTQKIMVTLLLVALIIGSSILLPRMPSNYFFKGIAYLSFSLGLLYVLRYLWRELIQKIKAKIAKK